MVTKEEKELKWRNMASNEDLMEAITEIKTELRLRNEEYQPVISRVRNLLDIHGDSEVVRARIAFINVWMEREKDRAELRKAIIKHGTILAMTAIVIFIFRAVWSDIVEIILGMPHKP